MARREYRLYVVELSRKVFTENSKFRQANPQYNGVLECLYVGLTSKDPKTRLQEHKIKALSKKGHKLHSSIVHRYGLYLRPSLYENLPSYTSRSEGESAETALAAELRRQRYAVWVG